MDQPMAGLRLQPSDSMITQGYLTRHFQGKSGMADAAMLDVAQDYLPAYIGHQMPSNTGDRRNVWRQRSET
jgi:hypothetical protein